VLRIFLHAVGAALRSCSPEVPDGARLEAVLIARIYAVLPLICPDGGQEMQLIAFVTEPVKRILKSVGEPAIPPPMSPARSPPVGDPFEGDPPPTVDTDLAEPAPEFEFDQTADG